MLTAGVRVRGRHYPEPHPLIVFILWGVRGCGQWSRGGVRQWKAELQSAVGGGWAEPSGYRPQVGVARGSALWESGNGMVDGVRRDGGVGHVWVTTATLEVWPNRVRAWRGGVGGRGGGAMPQYCRMEKDVRVYLRDQHHISLISSMSTFNFKTFLFQILRFLSYKNRTGLCPRRVLITAGLHGSVCLGRFFKKLWAQVCLYTTDIYVSHWWGQILIQLFNKRWH